MVVTKPICIPGNLTKAVETINADVGAVCTSPNINIWAKYKAVRSSVIGELTEAEKKTANYGMLFDYFKPAKKNYIVFPDGSRDTDDAYIAFSEGDKPWVKYLRPREGQTPKEWFRMFDFTAYGDDGNTKGYDSDALPPLRLTAVEGPYNITVGTTTQTYIVATFADNAANGNGLKYEDMKATDRPRTTDVTYEMKDMYLGFVLFYKPTWATLGQKWCIGVYEARQDYRYWDQNLPPKKLSDIAGTTERKVRLNLTDKLPAILDIGTASDGYPAPIKRIEVYARPVLYHGETHIPGQYEGTIEWSDEDNPVSTERFMPLRTPSDNPYNITEVEQDKVYIYCQVVAENMGYDASKGGWVYRYHLKLRMANGYSSTRSGTTEPFFCIDDLLVRLYENASIMDSDIDTIDYIVTPQGCNDDLWDITTKEAEEGGWKPTPGANPSKMWTFYGRPSVGGWKDKTFHNKFEYYETDQYIEMGQEYKDYPKYRYFKVKMNINPTITKAGLTIVKQHGILDDNNTTTVS